MPLGTTQATNYLRNNPDLGQYYQENIAGTPEEANYVGQGGNASPLLGFLSAHYDMAGAAEIQAGDRPAGSLNPVVTTTAAGTGGEGTGGAGTGGEGTGGAGTGGEGTGGEGTGGEGTTVDLSPILTELSNLQGQVTALQNQPSLMGETTELVTGQQGIRDVVDPLGAQVTGIGTQIGTADTDAGQTDLFAGQAGIQAGIGQAGTGQTDLFAGQRGIMSGIGTADTDAGQTDLFAGQAGLTTGQAGLQTGQAGLQTGQAGLQTGQEQLGTQIGALGTAAVTDAEGTVTQQPTGLFKGQAGLMSGQTGLGTQLSGIETDLAADIQAEASRLGGQIGDFRTAAEQYQRGATTQRGDIQGTQRAGQANLVQQIQGVGQGINRQADALARQRQEEAAQFQEATEPLQQAVSQFAQNAPAASVNQQVGPMGPMARDPRDALIQNLLRNAALMNRRPV
jgi:hypothetical protein